MSNIRIIIGHCNHSNITLSEIKQLDSFHQPEPLMIHLTDIDNEYKYTKEELQQLPQKVKHRKKRKFHDWLRNIFYGCQQLYNHNRVNDIRQKYVYRLSLF